MLLFSSIPEELFPLHQAVIKSNVDAIRVLAPNSDINQLNEYGLPPIVYASSDEIKDILKEYGATDFDIGQTALHFAAREGNVRKIRRLIAKDRKLLNKRDKSGMTPLHDAVLSRSLESVKALVDLGAFLNVHDNTDASPIVYAMENPHIRDFLLKAGAEDPSKDSLCDAVMTENIKKVKRIIRSNPAAVNDLEKGYAPLHVAALTGNLELVQLLVEAGADVNQYSQDTENAPQLPINIAYKKQTFSVVDYLLEMGSIDPLFHKIHQAAIDGDIATLEYILTEDPDIINYRDFQGTTPAMYAALYQRKSALKFLISKGANLDTVSDKCETLIDAAKIDGRHTPLSKYIYKKITLNKEIQQGIEKAFDILCKKAFMEAASMNKYVLFVVGECHNAHKVKQIEKAMLNVTQRYPFKTLFVEHPRGKESHEPLYTFAKRCQLDVIGVDNSAFREFCSKEKGFFLDERNEIMAHEINKTHHHALLFTGLAHVQGLLDSHGTILDPNKFHIVPINAVNIIPYHEFVEEEFHSFISDPRKVVQLQKARFSAAKPVVHRWNNTERARAVKRQFALCDQFDDQSIAKKPRIPRT
jgi:ankyrin repeat protein